MGRKIFNSYESKIRFNVDEFKSCNWQFRSTIDKYKSCVGGVNRAGIVTIYYILYDCIGILPICTI